MGERITIRASALTNYFGVGFVEPLQQLAYDLGKEEEVFTEEAKKRMMLGSMLEDSTLDFFEKFLDIIITERNTAVYTAFDGRVRCKFDGMTIYNGEETVVECKISNDGASPFTHSKRYLMQLQTYMESKNVQQALILGLLEGRPVWRLVKRDEEVIADIKEMVDIVTSILYGIATEDDFPMYLVEKYSGAIVSEEKQDFDMADYALLSELKYHKQEAKNHDARAEEITSYFKDKYNNVSYDDGLVKMSIASQKGRASFDKVAFNMAYPDIDLEQFNKIGNPMKVIRIK